MATKPLVVIVGPTASGKTALAIELASKFGGEIICADSRTIYSEMDIGTAKPSAEDRAKVKHWGLDLVQPDQRFSAAQFKGYALKKIDEIRERSSVPILVGGTGLYIDAVIFDYQFGDEADEKLRKELEKLSLEELYEYCHKSDIKLPENKKNKRYVIRAIEQKSINTKRNETPLKNTIIVGIASDRIELRAKIENRAEQIFHDGVVEEAKILGEKYGWSHESMTGNIYPLCREHIAGNMTLTEIKQKFIVQDWRLAKRQLTWLKRNPFIQWHPYDIAKEYLSSILASEH